MATIVKIPTLVHLVLPLKKFDIHVSVRVKNEHENLKKRALSEEEEIDNYILLGHRH
jgi:hypothetical protein